MRVLVLGRPARPGQGQFHVSADDGQAACSNSWEASAVKRAWQLEIAFEPIEHGIEHLGQFRQFAVHFLRVDALPQMGRGDGRRGGRDGGNRSQDAGGDPPAPGQPHHQDDDADPGQLPGVELLPAPPVPCESTCPPESGCGAVRASPLPDSRRVSTGADGPLGFPRLLRTLPRAASYCFSRGRRCRARWRSNRGDPGCQTLVAGPVRRASFP